jgi:hypothetical protein
MSPAEKSNLVAWETISRSFSTVKLLSHQKKEHDRTGNAPRPKRCRRNRSVSHIVTSGLIPANEGI